MPGLVNTTHTQIRKSARTNPLGIRKGTERLLSSYCARPSFALERLESIDAQRLLYRLPKPGPNGRTALNLTPLELIQRLAALIPPPRAHRHRYHGVLAPNASLRAAVTALAQNASGSTEATAAKETVETAVEGLWRSPARYLWAMLLARLYESTPLVCPICKADMRVVAFITDAGSIRHILEYIGEAPIPRGSPPRRGRQAGSPMSSRSRCMIRSPSQSPTFSSTRPWAGKQRPL